MKDRTGISDAEARRIIMITTKLRMTSTYQAAERMRRALGAERMAQMHEASREHGAVRLLIGTWERIAMFTQDFNERQLVRLFACHPVGLVWNTLQPGIAVIRGTGLVDTRYGANLEDLAKRYYEWTQTKEGAAFRTEAQQTVCAMFA
jgi:hypothetical protein